MLQCVKSIYVNLLRLPRNTYNCTYTYKHIYRRELAYTQHTHIYAHTHDTHTHTHTHTYTRTHTCHTLTYTQAHTLRNTQ